MNKNIMIPIAVMLMITFTAMAYFGFSSPEATVNQTTSGSALTNETEEWTIPGIDEEYTWTLLSALVILGVAIAIGTASGFNLLGSGLSDTSQVILTKGAMYLGLWAVLTVLSYPLLMDGTLATFGFFVYVALTIMFAIGFIQEIGGSGSDA